MSASNLIRQVSLALVGSLLLAGPALAVPDAVHDVHRLQKSDEFQQTIEKRCAICHTRERVDAALSEQVDLDQLMQQMIERGAVLNDRDKKVLGTFWGSPLKSDEESEPQPSHR
jgi:cytochrome c553